MKHTTCTFGPQVALLTTYHFVSCKHTVTSASWFGGHLFFNHWSQQILWVTSYNNPPYTVTIIPSPSKGSSSWRILTHCLQIYPRCAYTQLELNYFVNGLCMMHVTYGFFANRTNVGHTPITNKMTLLAGIVLAANNAPTTMGWHFLFVMKACHLSTFGTNNMLRPLQWPRELFVPLDCPSFYSSHIWVPPS